MGRPRSLSIEVGQRFGRWTVLEETWKPYRSRPGPGKRAVICRCDCGHTRTNEVYSLISGRSQSCGCLTRETAVEPGQRFVRLVVLELTRSPGTAAKPAGYPAAACRCDCGNETTVRLDHLAKGETTSCGCLARETAAELCRTVKPHTKHGLGGHPLFHTWHDMMSRCYNPDNANFKHYGGRGITVCTEWHDIANFITWIQQNLGPRPDGMSLDRIDNDGPYAPGNVRWRDQSGQCVNRRPNITASSRYKGVTRDTTRTKWVAQIKTRGRRRYLGRYDNEEAAARAYDAAALNLWGADAWLNAEHFILEGSNA
jgi:hypothetical protein